MIKLKYVLLARNAQGKKVSVVSTGWEITRGVRGRCIDPHFQRFVWSCFALSSETVSVEAFDLAPWKPGTDIESLPSVVLIHKVSEYTRELAFSFSDGEEVGNG